MKHQSLIYDLIWIDVNQQRLSIDRLLSPLGYERLRGQDHKADGSYGPYEHEPACKLTVIQHEISILLICVDIHRLLLSVFS